MDTVVCPELICYIYPPHAEIISIDKLGNREMFGMLVTESRPDYGSISAGFGGSLSPADNQILRPVCSCDT
jgi:hypothetical protein